MWVTGIPTHGGRPHIEYELRGVRPVSNFATVLVAVGVRLEPRWTSKMTWIKMPGRWSGMSENARGCQFHR